MKIAHIITGLAADGAETMLYKLLCAMDRTRFEPIVVSLTKGGALAPRIAELGIRVLEPGAGAFAALLRWRPDILQGWMYHGNLAAQAMAPMLPAYTPVLWNVRGSHHRLCEEKPATALAIRLSGRLSRLPYKIVNNSVVSATLHERYLRFVPGRWEIIPNGFDLAQFAPSEAARGEVRAELNTPPDATLIGLMARYHPVKDHGNFLRAAGIFSKDAPEAHFVLAGAGVDANQPALTQQIQDAGIQSRIHLLGSRCDMPRLTAALDIATSSSYSEGFPNVLGEAMSCGLPCVTTDSGDSAWLVGDTGLVVPPRLPGALAAAWKDLTSRGPEGMRRLGSAARRRIELHFSIGAVAARYAQLYERAFECKERKGYRLCAA